MSIFKLNISEIGNKTSVIVGGEITIHANELSTNEESTVSLGHINPYFIWGWV